MRKNWTVGGNARSTQSKTHKLSLREIDKGKELIRLWLEKARRKVKPRRERREMG
jgi:hypothetical protein